jgi:sporulation protein YlmC with PRC-barrel domain
MRSTMTKDRLQELRGVPVYSRDREKIGSVEDLYFDVETGEPEWLAVGAGILSTRHKLVPITGATFEDEGVIVPLAKEHVKDAPDVMPDAISPHLERELWSYYRQFGNGHREFGDAFTESSQRAEAPAYMIRVRRWQWEPYQR